MSRLSTADIKAILEIVSRHPEGATAADVAQELVPPREERTIQNWLAKLESAGCVTRVGDGPAARYFLAAQPAPAGTPTAAVENPVRELGESDFARMLEPGIPSFVIAGSTEQTASLHLLQQAGKLGLSPDATKAYLAYARRRLAAVTYAEVADFGITAEKFAEWQSGYARPANERTNQRAGTGNPPAAERGPSTAGGNPLAGTSNESSLAPAPRVRAAPAPRESAASIDPGRERRDPHRTVPPADEGVVSNDDDGRSAHPRNRGTPSIASELTETKEVGIEILVEFVKALKIGNVARRAVPIVKRSLTPFRVGVTIAWPILVLYAARQLAIGGAMRASTAGSLQAYLLATKLVGWGVILVSGLPWLIFHWRDVRKARQAAPESAPGIDWAAILVLVFFVGYGSNYVAQTILGFLG